MTVKKTAVRRLNRRQFLILSGISIGALTLDACRSGTAQPSGETESDTAPISQEPQSGGTLRIAFSDSPANLIPWELDNFEKAIFVTSMYESLARFDENLVLQPALAESWQSAADGLSWTFKLRQGVTFHDGSPFSAQDVVYSVEQILDPDNAYPGAVAVSFIDSVAAVDDFTVLFKLSEPNMDFPVILTSPLNSFVMVPAGRTIEALAETPVGTGPFKFGEHVVGERITVVRNDSYWHEGRPYLEELQLFYIPEPATQVASLTSGEVDVIWQVPIESISALENVADIDVVEVATNSSQPIIMQVDMEPFTDKRVRQALKYLINREGFVQAVLQGRGVVGNDQPVVPSGLFWGDVSPYEYDVEKAKALLAEAGYPDGFEVTLATTNSRPGMAESAVVFQEMVKAAGIRVNIEQLPADSYWVEYLSYPIFVSNWPLVASTDAMLTLSQHSQSVWNESGLQSEEIDSLIERARAEADENQRQVLYTQVQQLIQDEGGFIAPYFRSTFYAHHTKVQGIVYTPEIVLYPHEVWLRQV